MASDLLSLLIRANLVAAAAILAVLLLRGITGRVFGARAGYVLWAVVPLAMAAVLLPARKMTLLVTPAPASELPPVTSDHVLATVASAVLPRIDLAGPAVAIWAIGALACLAALAHSQFAFGQALGRLRREDGVFRSDVRGFGPVLLGVLRPRIVLPADFEARFSAGERTVVLAHEQAHLKGGDHLVNAVAALIRCLCWFNPLVHLAARHVRVDQELACDAAVIERHPEHRRDYAEAMLKAQFDGLTAPLACHWPASGPHPLKRRIALLQEAGPSRTRRAAGLAVIVAAGLGASAAAWAAQPPRVEVVERPAAKAARMGSAEAWRLENHAEARAAAVRRSRNIPLATAQRLDRNLVDAVLAGDDAATAALIKAGADVNARITGDGSPLIVAAREGRIDIATRLIRSGADVNGYVLYDETPLINAARSGHLPMVRFLLDNGADPNLAVHSGNKPLEVRSPLGMARNRMVAAYLKSRGARS